MINKLTSYSCNIALCVFKQQIHTILPKSDFYIIDNIVIPDFVAGATESWGLIPYREALLYEPGVSSASDENWIAEVIAHEISHMV